MKKFLLTALVAGVAALSASAATETFQWSYCQSPVDLGAFGTNRTEPYGVAVTFNNPTYAGMKITKVDAYLNADASTINSFSNTSVFITSALGGNPLRAKSVNPTPATLQRESLAVLSYELEEPLEIGTGTLYIGYNLTVNNIPATNNTSQKYPILVDKNVYQEGTCWINTPYLTEGQWDINGYTYGAAVIYVTIERETYEYGMGIDSPGIVYAEVGKEFSTLATVSNTGATPINSITYNYSIDEGTPVSNTITLDEPLAPSVDKRYQVLLPMNAVDAVGAHLLDIEVTAVNGQPNEAQAFTSCELDVFPYMPQHRPLVEEYTALECGYCPRGYVAMEYISETYPDDAVVICYHAEFSGKRDPMTVTGAMPVPTTNFPTASIDRLGIVDPYYGDYSVVEENLGIVRDMFARAETVAIADIEIKNVEFNATDSVINVQTDVTFMKNVDNDQYRIGYVLSCNGLYDPTWKQVNYFSRDAVYKDTPLIQQFYALPASVYGLTFNDVAVMTTNMRGIANSITNVEIGNPVTNEYSFNVKDIKNIYGDSLNPYCQVDQMVVNAFIVNKSNGSIVNACKFNVGNVYDAVEGIAMDSDAVSTVYYDLQGRRVANPDKGIYVKSETLTDGTVRTSKVIVR